MPISPAAPTWEETEEIPSWQETKPLGGIEAEADIVREKPPPVPMRTLAVPPSFVPSADIISGEQAEREGLPPPDAPTWADEGLVPANLIQRGIEQLPGQKLLRLHPQGREFLKTEAEMASGFTSPTGIAMGAALALVPEAALPAGIAFGGPEIYGGVKDILKGDIGAGAARTIAGVGMVAGGIHAARPKPVKPPPLPRTIEAAREAGVELPAEPATPEITPAESARVERINTALEQQRETTPEFKQEPIPVEQPKPSPRAETEWATFVKSLDKLTPLERERAINNLKDATPEELSRWMAKLFQVQLRRGIEEPAKESVPVKTALPAESEVTTTSGQAGVAPNARLAADFPIQEPYSDNFAVSVQVAATDFPGNMRQKVIGSLPEAIAKTVVDTRLFQGEVVPTNTALSVPARVEIIFKDKESAQKAIDYFKGEEAKPAGAQAGGTRIVAVASRLGDVVETGPIHFDAEVKLRKRLNIGTDDPRVENIEHGFLDDKGNFLDREQAFALAKQSNQLQGDVTKASGFLDKGNLKIEPSEPPAKPAAKEAVAPVAEAKAEAVVDVPNRQRIAERLVREGLSNEDAFALIAGEKTPSQVVEEWIEMRTRVGEMEEFTPGQRDVAITEQMQRVRDILEGVEPDLPKPDAGIKGEPSTVAKTATVQPPQIIERINARDRRDWSKLPPSFQADAVKATFNDIKELFPRQAISQRVRASKATTFSELREAVDSALKPKPARTTAGEGPSPQALGFAQVILPKRFFQDVKSSMTKWFKIGGHLPEEAVRLRRDMDAKITATDADVRNAERDLMGALKKEFGLSTVEMLGGGSRKIPPQFVQAMNEHLKGNPQNLPPEIRGVIDNMRAQITGWSDRIIDMFRQQLNQLTPGTPKYESLGKLIETIENNRDVYVHRAYKFFDSKSPAPAWYDDLPLADRMRAEDFVRNNSPTPLTPEQARSKLLDWLSDLRDEGTTGAGSKVGAKDLSIFMRRKVIAPEIRAVLGEYNSPLINYAKSVSKMARWAANQKFLEEVRRVGMGQFLFEEGANPPGFNARIAPEGSDTMSPLSGLRTTQEIAEAFKDINRTPEYGALARNYLVLNAWTKVAQTAHSIMTQSRNLSSRLWMAGMAGHWNVGKAGKSFKAIAQDFAGSDPAWRAYLKDAYEHGVIGDTSRARELREIVKDAALNDVQPSDLYSWSLARAVKKVGYKIPTDIYRLSDELGNLYGWENEMVNVREIHPTWTDAQVKAEAAKIVRTIYPTYSESPRIVQQFRKNVLVGPFVNFPYQVWRNMWNAFGLSISEIRSSNPVERKIGAKRLASQVGTIAAAYAAQEFAKSALGISTQEEEDFRRFQPPWARNSKWLFLNKDAATGELGAVNLSYIDPYSYATDIVPAILSGIRGDKDSFEIFAESTRETFRPWVSEQMLLKAIVEARNGKTDRGKDIFNPTDSTFEKFNKQSAHVLKSLEPGTMQRAERRIIPAAKGEQPIYGRKLEFGPEVARELTGVAVEKFNFKNGLAFRASDFVKAEDASEDAFRRVLSQTQTTSSEDLVAAYAEANDRRFKLWKEFRGDYLAAIRRGVSDREAANLLVNRRVSRATAEAIRRGVYEPMPITDTMHDRARERKRAIPMTEIRETARTYSRRSLDD